MRLGPNTQSISLSTSSPQNFRYILKRLHKLPKLAAAQPAGCSYDAG